MNYTENIIEELIRYTDSAGRKLKKETREYLKQYSIKPKHDIILYRGFALTLDVYGDYTKLEDHIKLTKYLKVELELII